MGSFRKATRRQRPLRMALFGPSGSGKTFTALTIARGLVGDGTIALIDTERSSASVYAKDGDAGFDFDMASLKHYAHTDYIALIEEAAEHDALIIDSVSHAYDAEGGLLSVVDDVAKKMRSDSSFRAWGDTRVKTAQQRLWASILDFPGHLIVTMRSKTEYAMSKDEKGRTTVQKIGLAPIQRAGVEYEFDMIARMEPDNTMIIEKARDPEGKLEGAVIHKPGADLVAQLSAWLGKGDTAIEDYKKQIVAVCEEISKRDDKPLGGVKARAWEIVKTKIAGTPFENLRNDELAALPDHVRGAMTMSDETERQLREAKREAASA